MTGWPDQPVIYEINTAVWLNELGRTAGRRVTLADVADADWDAVTPAGVNAVWLMGVWERTRPGSPWLARIPDCRSRLPVRCRTCNARMSSDRRTAFAAIRSTRLSVARTRWPRAGPRWTGAGCG